MCDMGNNKPAHVHLASMNAMGHGTMLVLLASGHDDGILERSRKSR